MIFLESPRRVHDALVTMAEVLGGERPAALCRELTKTHEEVLRAPLAELVRATADGVLGEVVLVVAGAEPVVVGSEDPARRALALPGPACVSRPRPLRWPASSVCAPTRSTGPPSSCVRPRPEPRGTARPSSTRPGAPRPGQVPQAAEAPGRVDSAMVGS